MDDLRERGEDSQDQPRDEAADGAPLSRAERPERREPPPARPDERESRPDETSREGGGSRGGGDARGEDETRKKEEQDRARRRRRPWLIAIGAVVLLALVAGGLWWWLSTRGEESTDDAYTDGTTVAVAPKVAGYVVELLITDNMRVKAGDLMLRIDPRDYQAARDQAQARYDLALTQLESAKLNLELAKVQFPARLRQAEAARDQAQAQAQKALADLRRQRSVDPRATTQQEIDAAAAAARQATATLNQQEANVQLNQPVPTNIDLASTQVKQAEAQVAQAKADLEQAELNLSYTELRAPQDGWVTKRNVYLGSYVQPGALLFSLVSPKVWVTANFKETQLNRMRPGQSVRISVDAYPSLRLEGHVDSIQMGSGSRFSAFPAENATGNYVKIVQRVPVKILIDSGYDPEKGLPLGLSVEPVVKVGE